MFTTHTPQLRKAFACFAVSIGLFSINVAFPQGFLQVFGWLLAVAGVVEIIAVYWNNLVENRNEQYRTQVQVINALASADPDVRNAIGQWFPQYNFRWAGKTIMCWQDTIVPLEVFQEFMHQSNAQYTAPERDWKAKGATYHRYWNLIYSKLVELGLVVPESAAGSHSYMWRGKGYDRAWEFWMQSGRDIPELD